MVLVSPAQLKTTNQIFNEHLNLKAELDLQKQQAERYKRLYKDELEIDSMYETTISQLKQSIYYYDYQVEQQDIKIKTAEYKLKCWRICGITISIGVLLYVCLKN